jgi:hypothetical protein
MSNPGAPTINMKTSTVGPREVPELKVQVCHHQRENIDGGPPGGARGGDPGAPTINMKTLTAGLREVLELKVQERPPSTCKCQRRAPGWCRSWRSGRAHHQRENINGGPPGGAEAEGPGAPTINVKTLMTGPREVPELKIRERPPST